LFGSPGNLTRSLATVQEPSILEEISIKKDTKPEKPVSSPKPSLNSYQMKETTGNCLWHRFKTNILHLWSDLKPLLGQGSLETVDWPIIKADPWGPCFRSTVCRRCNNSAQRDHYYFLTEGTIGNYSFVEPKMYYSGEMTL